MNKALDATQLEFKKLDPENIDWVTIRGNHVPIPKNGSREQKARAIKEWFANKKKDLPESKGLMSVYSARFEHEQPERKAKRTGENAEVHGSGQYTQRNISKNLARYFDRFKRKRVWFMPSENDEMSNRKYSQVGEWLAQYISLGNGRPDSFDVGYQKMSDYINKELAKAKEHSYKYEIEKYENILSQMTKMKPEHFRTTANSYLIGGEAVLNKDIQRYLQNAMLYKFPEAPDQEKWLQGMKDNISAVKGGKKYADMIKSWADIQPAKAQMSVVRLPANKYYIKETKKVYEQSPFVINAFRDVCIDRAIQYQIKHWTSTTKDNDKFTVEKFKEDHPAVYGLLEQVYNKAVELHQKMQQDQEYIPIHNEVWKQVVENPQGSAILAEIPHEDKNQLTFHDEQRESVYSSPRDTFWFNPWTLSDEQREEYYAKTKAQGEHGELSYKDFETIVARITNDVKSTIDPDARGMKKRLMAAGIKGIHYYGGVDGWGNVTFDPKKDIKVLRKITDPNEIRALIEKQKKINPDLYEKEKKDA